MIGYSGGRLRIIARPGRLPRYPDRRHREATPTCPRWANSCVSVTRLLSKIDNALGRWKEALARQDQEKQARSEILANGTPEQKREQQAHDRKRTLSEFAFYMLLSIFLSWL